MKLISKNVGLNIIAMLLIIISIIFAVALIGFSYMYLYPYYQSFFVVNKGVTPFEWIYLYIIPTIATLGSMVVLYGVFYSFVYIVVENIKICRKTV